MAKVKGIVLYDIQMDSTLNGVYTNSDPQVNGTILTETARLVNQYPDIEGGIGTQIFEYDCFYFDFPNGGVNCRLIFKVNGNIYHTEWILNGNIIFKGQGFQMNDSQIALSYWSNS